MLSENDFHHLKLLYEQLYKKNEFIKNLIETNDWDGVDTAVSEKESLVEQIVQFEKPRLDDIKQDEFLNNFRLELIELEKKNVELVLSLKDKLMKDMENAKQAKRILNTYEPSLNNSINTIDISQDD